MNRLWLVAAGVVFASAVGAVNYALDADVRAVQAGEAALVCVMRDGERVIEPSRIVGRVDGVWLFDNGQARNCEIIKGVMSHEKIHTDAGEHC